MLTIVPLLHVCYCLSQSCLSSFTYSPHLICKLLHCFNLSLPVWTTSLDNFGEVMACGYLLKQILIMSSRRPPFCLRVPITTTPPLPLHTFLPSTSHTTTTTGPTLIPTCDTSAISLRSPLLSSATNYWMLKRPQTPGATRECVRGGRWTLEFCV